MVVLLILNAAIAVVTARGLGPSGRGQLVLLTTIVALTGLVVSAGSNTAIRYHLYSKASPVELDAYLGLTVALALLAVLLSGAVAALSFEAAGAPLSGGGVLLAAMYGGTFLLAVQLSDAMNAHGWTATSMCLSASGVMLQLGLVMVLLVTDRQQVEWYFGAMVVGVLANVALAGGRLRRGGVSLRPRIHRARWLRLLRTGIPAIGLNAGQALAFRLDRYLIAVWMGSSSVGLYSVAATASESLRAVPMAFGQVVFFRVASHQLAVDDITRRRRQLLLLMVFPIGIIAVLAPTLIHLLFGPPFTEATTPLRILLIGELAVMSFQIDARVLSAQGRTKASGSVGMLGLGVIVLLDVVLIPTFGLVGAAWASVFAYFVMGVSAHVAVKRSSVSREA